MDIEVNIKYKCKNFFSEDDLENRSTEELFKEIYESFGRNIDLFSNEFKVTSVKEIKK